MDIRLNSTKTPNKDVLTIYTGSIDDLLSNVKLPYRSLRWYHETSYEPYKGILNGEYYDYPVLNTPSEDYTRIIDHNYFNTRKSDIHFLSYEYPEEQAIWYSTNNVLYKLNNNYIRAVI